MRSKRFLRLGLELVTLRRLPIIFKVQTLALAFAGLTAVVVSTVIDGRRYEEHSVAIPSVNFPLVSWDAERQEFAGKVSRAFGIHRKVAEEFSGWILEGARRQDISPELLASLVFTESSFRKNVRSSIGAIGPAQVRDDYWGSFCGSDLTDPAENIYCGAQILAHFRDVCGSLECALQSYNIGPYNRDDARWVKAGSRYLNKIASRMAQLESVTL